MHDIGKKGFIFGLIGTNPNILLLDPTYFTLKATQTSFMRTEQGQMQGIVNNTNLPLNFWGDRFRSIFPSPAFENFGMQYFIWTNSTDYSVGGQNYYKFKFLNQI